ncbi:hypothetical protein ZWY2020_005629 [Hordeum vulgare]|nr:hypothetical protein ZWY2020_005629 [Hordeum vulgare]
MHRFLYARPGTAIPITGRGRRRAGHAWRAEEEVAGIRLGSLPLMSCAGAVEAGDHALACSAPGRRQRLARGSSPPPPASAASPPFHFTDALLQAAVPVAYHPPPNRRRKHRLPLPSPLLRGAAPTPVRAFHGQPGHPGGLPHGGCDTVHVIDFQPDAG